MRNNEDRNLLQMDLNKISSWSKKRKIEFNAIECKIMEFGISKRQSRNHSMEMEHVSKTKKEKNRVTFSDNLSPK